MDVGFESGAVVEDELEIFAPPWVLQIYLHTLESFVEHSGNENGTPLLL